MLILEIAAGVALAPVLWWGAAALCNGGIDALDAIYARRKGWHPPSPNAVNRIGAAWIVLILGSFAALGVAALLA